VGFFGASNREPIDPLFDFGAKLVGAKIDLGGENLLGPFAPKETALIIGGFG
jgi:hypothetical protein